MIIKDKKAVINILIAYNWFLSVVHWSAKKAGRETENLYKNVNIYFLLR